MAVSAPRTGDVTQNDLDQAGKDTEQTGRNATYDQSLITQDALAMQKQNSLITLNLNQANARKGNVAAVQL